MRRILLLSLALPFMLGSKAAAQTCVGMPSFTSGQMQVAAGGQFADGTSSFAGTFGYGQPKSLYGKAGSAPPPTTGSTVARSTSASNAGYQVPSRPPSPPSSARWRA